MDVKKTIETLEKIENNVPWLTFKEVCALSDTIQVLEKYIKEEGKTMDIEEAIEIVGNVDMWWITEREAEALTILLTEFKKLYKKEKNNEKLC